MDSSTSDQHQDLIPESVRLSKKHIKVFRLFRLLIHHSHLTITISTGVVESLNINCDDTLEVGRAAAAKMIAVSFTDIKMKRCDRAVNVAEQAHQLTLLFNASMKLLLHQQSFLGSPNCLTNKTRLISTIAQCLANDSV